MSYTPSINVQGFERELTLNGNCSYNIIGDRVTLQIDEIANNRQPGNISGTLAIELWALPQPYAGDQFSGVSLAATTIGEISSQCFLPQCRYELIFSQPPAGTWTLCLMLREWENGAFVTRDYINFALPYTVESPQQNRANIRVTREESNNVINVAFKDEPQAPAKGETPAKSQLPVKGMDEVIAKKPAAKRSLAPETKKPGAPASTPVSAQLSVNRASQHELESLKGVSRKLAKAIVDSRPYKALDDLLAVKGMGKKLLNQLEKSLKL